jgi:GTP-binding protein
LLHIVDVEPYESDISPVEAAEKIVAELALWSDDLAKKTRWLVLNKIDRLQDDAVEVHCQAIVDALNWSGPVHKISAIKKNGVGGLMFAIMDFLEQSREHDREEA